MIYLLDTNTVITLIRGRKPNAKARARAAAIRLIDRCRRAHQQHDDIALSAITVAELEFGARRSGTYVVEIAAVQKVIVPFKRYAFDEVDGPWHYGRVRRHLEESGLVIGQLDLLIAAHALSLHATVVTNNLEHFQRIPNLPVTDWTRAT